jgi:hypothetical protein
VVLVDHLVLDVHVMLGEAGIELQLLEDRRDAVALDVHDLANALGIDRARARRYGPRSRLTPVQVVAVWSFQGYLRV